MTSKIIFTCLLISFFLLPTYGQKGNNRIEVKEINLPEINRIIKERNSKLLLINIWATWCVPCREEFPDLIKIAKNYSGELDIIAISVDYTDEVESKIIPFLNSVNSNFPVFVSGVKNQEDFIDFFSSEWNGALPASFLYEVKGEKVKELHGKQNYESLSKAIKVHIKK